MIEDLVLNSPKIPFVNKLLIDEEKLFTHLDTLRQFLPKEINEARGIVENRDKILADAAGRAKAIIAAAEERAKVLISNNEILKKSLQEAETLKYEISKEKEQSQEEADKYADCVLENLEGRIEKALDVIKNGREKLAGNA